MVEKTKRKRSSKKQDEVAGGNGVGVQDANPDGTADPIFAEDNVMRLTDAELDRFNLMRIKMENLVQSIRVSELELDKLRREFRDQEYQKEQLIRQKRVMVEPTNNEYLDYVRQLAKKYKVNPKYLGIDDETGVIRDLTPQEEAEPG